MSEVNTPSSGSAYASILNANEKLQLVTKLTKCRACLRALREPVTLYCGNSVCLVCLPPFNPHTARKFDCPVLNCQRKSHLFGDIKIDVTLQKLTCIIQKEVEINKKRFPTMSCLPVAGSDEKLTVDDNTLFQLRAASQSPSMAFLESDMWSDVESNGSLSPLDAKACDHDILPVVESPSSLSTSSESSPSSPSSPSSEPPCFSSSQPTSCSIAASQDISFGDKMLSELECQICYMLFYEPITTPCGHTFCKDCILRSIDHAEKCLLCRHKLPGHTFFHNHPINLALHHVITTMFSRLWYDRRMAVEANLYGNNLDNIPIFVCSLVFPKMPLFLHIFEPRYRLMLRRCMESKPQRFGMVLPGRNGEPYNDYGTMLEISNVTILPDGRAMVETIGSFRFKVIERRMCDGYNVGKVERVNDISPEEEEMEQADMATAQPSREGSEIDVEQELRERQGDYATAQSSIVAESRCSTAELIMKARLFLDRLKATSAPWLIQRVNSTYGDMPENDTDFSWWVASVLPIDDQERCRLLETTSTRERMKLVTGWMEQLQDQWWFARGGCMVM